MAVIASGGLGRVHGLAICAAGQFETFDTHGGDTQSNTPTLRRYWEMSAVELREHAFQSQLPSHLLKNDLINQLIGCKLRRCANIDWVLIEPAGRPI